MKYFLSFISIFLVATIGATAQVGIGIETPDPSSILHLESTNGGLLLPRLTTTQRDAIVSPAKGLTIYNTVTNGLEINTNTPELPTWKLLSTVNNAAPVLAPSVTTTQMNALPTTVGSLVFNTTENCLFQYKSSKWQSLCEAESLKIVTLYKNFNGSDIILGDSAFHNLSFGNLVADQKEIDTDYFTVLGDGKIKVLKTGSYMISASFAVRNLKPGVRKYLLAVLSGDNATIRLGYLARGFVTIPTGGTNGEYFGASGVFQYYFTANDVINVQYNIDNTNTQGSTGPTTLNGDLMHIGIVKL